MDYVGRTKFFLKRAFLNLKNMSPYGDATQIKWCLQNPLA